MILKKIEKKLAGKFINRYDLTYETVDGKDKIYEMISRDPGLEDKGSVISRKADAVVMIVHDISGEKLLLNREFRLAVGDFVYNFPAGLIDPGETPEIAAAREIKEETGLDLVSIDDHIGLSYSAVGFSNESNVCIVGRAEGQFAPSTSTVEEIEAGWFTKEEVRELLKAGYFAGRTQAYCYLWSKE